MPDINAETVQRMSIITLVIYGVVLLIVALLLTLIVREARRIKAGVSEI